MDTDNLRSSNASTIDYSSISNPGDENEEHVKQNKGDRLFGRRKMFVESPVTSGVK